MAEKEEQLLEKELIFEQVGRLADRVKRRADTGKGDTLDLAKKVSYTQEVLLRPSCNVQKRVCIDNFTALINPSMSTITKKCDNNKYSYTTAWYRKLTTKYNCMTSH